MYIAAIKARPIFKDDSVMKQEKQKREMMMMMMQLDGEGIYYYRSGFNHLLASACQLITRQRLTSHK